MDIDIALSLSRSDLIAGEGASLSMTVANRTEHPASFIDPRKSDAWPVIDVIDRDRGVTSSYGPSAIKRRHQHDFLPKRPPSYMDLAPGGEITWSDELLARIDPLTEGRYELRARTMGALGEVVSSSIEVSVAPLDILSFHAVEPFGGHGGHRSIVVAHDAGDGRSTLFFTALDTGMEGLALRSSSRLIEVDHHASFIGSTGRYGVPYPAHWIVWLHEGALYGVYCLYGEVQSGIASGPIEAKRGHIIPSVLLDYANHPAPMAGRVLVWQPALSTVGVYRIDTSGVSHERSIPVRAGMVAWAEAFMNRDGEARVVFAVQRGDHVDLEVLMGLDATPRSIGRWEGTILGAGVTFADDGSMVVVAVVRDPNGLTSLAFARANEDGSAAVERVVPIRSVEGPGLMHPRRALVSVTPLGYALAVLTAQDGALHVALQDGACRPLPDDLDPFGDVVGALFAEVSLPLLIMASAEHGITYQHLHGHR